MISMLLIFSNLFAAGSDHLKISLRTKDNLVFVEAKPLGKFVINDEAPWALEIVTSENLSLVKKAFTKSDLQFAKAMASFEVGTKTALKMILKIKVTAFVCTDNKSQCFRDVVEQELTL